MLKALAALVVDRGLVPSTHTGQFTLPIIPGPEVLTPSSGLLGHLHVGNEHTNACTDRQAGRQAGRQTDRQTHTHQKNMKTRRRLARIPSWTKEGLAKWVSI